jgi:hypothetical protein
MERLPIFLQVFAPKHSVNAGGLRFQARKKPGKISNSALQA